MDKNERTQREGKARAHVRDDGAQAEQFDEHAAADIRRRAQCVRPHQPAVLFRHFVRALIEKTDEPFEEHLPARRRRFPFPDNGQTQDERDDQKGEHDDKTRKTCRTNEPAGWRTTIKSVTKGGKQHYGVVVSL